MSSPVLVGLTAGVARPAEVDQHEHAPVDCPLLWRSGRDLPLAEQAVTGGSAGRRDPGGRRRPSPRLTLAPWRAVTRSGISGSEQIGVTDKLPAALGQVASGAAFAARGAGWDHARFDCQCRKATAVAADDRNSSIALVSPNAASTAASLAMH